MTEQTSASTQTTPWWLEHGQSKNMNCSGEYSALIGQCIIILISDWSGAGDSRSLTWSEPMWTQWRQVFYQNQRSKSCWRSCMRRMILRSNSEEEMKKWRKSSTDVKNIDLHTTHQNVIFIDFYTLHFTFIYHWFILLKFQTMFMLWSIKRIRVLSLMNWSLDRAGSLTGYLSSGQYLVLIGWLYEIMQRSGCCSSSRHHQTASMSTLDWSMGLPAGTRLYSNWTI